MKSKFTRVIAIILAAMMLSGTLFSVLSMLVSATDPIDTSLSIAVESVTCTDSSNKTLTKITSNTKPFNIIVVYSIPSLSTVDAQNIISSERKVELTALGGFNATDETLSTVELFQRKQPSDEARYRAIFTNLTYNENGSADVGFQTSYKYKETIEGNIVDKTQISKGIFTVHQTKIKETSSSSVDDDKAPTSNIVIENIVCTDSDGERIDKITKNSPAFNIVVTYADLGLRDVDDSEFSDKSLDAYMTDSGGFTMNSGNKGSLTYVKTAFSDAPRFRVSFRNIKFKEGGVNSISFVSVYSIEEWSVEGKGTGAVQAASTDKDEDKMKPLIPHIIVNEYSYGGNAIAAGDSFTLNMTMTNTSSDIPLENIIMTVSPATVKSDTAGSTTGGLTITSASNTYYIEKLGLGESFSHVIDLRAEPNAAVGSHKVEIKFKFQYVDEINKERVESTDEEGIAIPVTQIDRFSVDPITEIPLMLMAGESGYITVSFINRGKTTTYNVSGIISGNISNTGSSQHFGNLEAGKAGKLDFEVTTFEPGEMKGEILIQYEDENTKQNELKLPFSIPVEAMYVPEPPVIDPNAMGEQPKTVGTTSIVLFIIGGILISAPIGMYIFKRVKAKGIEAFNEDF